MDYEDIFRLLTRKKSLFCVALGPVSYESSKPAYSQGVPVECRAYIPESAPCGQPALQTQLVTDLHNSLVCTRGTTMRNKADKQTESRGTVLVSVLDAAVVTAADIACDLPALQLPLPATPGDFLKA